MVEEDCDCAARTEREQRQTPRIETQRRTRLEHFSAVDPCQHLPIRVGANDLPGPLGRELNCDLGVANGWELGMDEELTSASRGCPCSATSGAARRAADGRARR